MEDRCTAKPRHLSQGHPTNQHPYLCVGQSACHRPSEHSSNAQHKQAVNLWTLNINQDTSQRQPEGVGRKWPWGGRESIHTIWCIGWSHFEPGLPLPRRKLRRWESNRECTLFPRWQVRDRIVLRPRVPLYNRQTRENHRNLCRFELLFRTNFARLLYLAFNIYQLSTLK